MSFNLGFIGGGNMSYAIAQGILSKETHPASKIWVSGPRMQSLEKWRKIGTNVTLKNGEVYHECDVIFLGVKPSMLHQAVVDCVESIPKQAVTSKHVLFVSMLAGIPLYKLDNELKTISKTISIVRMLPNTPMMVGAGACVYTPDRSVSEAECALLEKLMTSCGAIERIPESLMDSVGSLVGCGPAYIYIVIEALADGAVKQGVPRDMALRMAAQMVTGSAQMVLQTGKHPGLLKDEVCSPGGTTICGVAELEDGNLRSTFIKALQASTLKSKELGLK